MLFLAQIFLLLLLLLANVESSSDQVNQTCASCVSFFTNTLDELIDIIGNLGVVSSCEDVCTALKSVPWEETTCDLVCEITGITAFTYLVTMVDPDPIYICSYVNVCPVTTSAKGNFKAALVSPLAGRQGTVFTLKGTYAVTSAIGTGQLVITVNSASSSFPLEYPTLLVQIPVGKYAFNQKVVTIPGNTQQFLPGAYNVSIQLCEGTCGSIHSWSYTLDQISTSFNIISNSTST